MSKLLHRFGRFYSRVIVNFIGIFIFVGILSAVFGDCGWMPNGDIYAISQFVYRIVIPLLIAYTAGDERKYQKEQENPTRLHTGGTIAVMATAGLLLANENSGILGAMILGPLSGAVWDDILEPLVKRAKTGLEMLVRNVIAAFAGVLMAVFSFYLLAPFLSAFADILLMGVDSLLRHRMIWLLSIIIEPAKVFFLNNSINYGILLPLGIQQAKDAGESILFLLETNPGPGFGVLAALCLWRKDRRSEYAAAMFVEFAGGIHEIYFPEILSNLWLIAALICGGAAGNFCFMTLQAAATGVVSPGSIVAVLLVCTKKRMVSVLVGILISAAVSAAVALLILKLQSGITGSQEVTGESQTDGEELQEVTGGSQTDGEESQTVLGELQAGATEMKIESGWKAEMNGMLKVGFVCNAGVGSSAMGAALFRRKLREMNLTGIEVDAYASDQIPEDVTVIVCQRDFKELLPFETKARKVCTVESLLNQSEYTKIIEEIKRSGEGTWI